jgi:hypothetical protein
MMKLLLFAGAAFGLVVLLLLLPLTIAAIVFGAFLFWVWMLIDAIRNDRISGWARVGWTALIWCTHWIGALFYFFLARRNSRPATA